jgi:hypothetical protein
MRKALKAIWIATLLATLSIGRMASGTQSPQQSAANPAPPSPPSSLQEAAPNQAPAIRASSDLVRIDVEVTDKAGKPVKGLTPEQFTITENGKAQKISIFTFQDIEKMETVRPTTQSPSSSRLIARTTLLQQKP